MSKPYPLYTKDFHKGLKPGLYLALFHGFPAGQFPDEVENWGEPGPVIGPLEFVHTTYGSHIKIRFLNAKDCAKYPFKHRYGPAKAPDSADLIVDGDTIEFDGVEYGDWTVFYVK